MRKYENEKNSIEGGICVKRTKNSLARPVPWRRRTRLFSGEIYARRERQVSSCGRREMDVATFANCEAGEETHPFARKTRGAGAISERARLPRFPLRARRGRRTRVHRSSPGLSPVRALVSRELRRFPYSEYRPAPRADGETSRDVCATVCPPRRAQTLRESISRCNVSRARGALLFQPRRRYFVDRVTFRSGEKKGCGKFVRKRSNISI